MMFNPAGWSPRWSLAGWLRPPQQRAPRITVETSSASLPAGTRIYAVGDIHGMSTLTVTMLNCICEDAAKIGDEPERTIIVLCGDYIDRGPDSAGVLSILSALSLSGIEVVALRGNHEEMLQRFMEQPERFGPRWMTSGGDRTLNSYGITVPSGSPESYHEARAALARCMPMSHFSFLSELTASFCVGDYFFCHAGARPRVALADQSERDLLWIGDSFTGDDHGFEKVIVHGHHTVPQPLIAKHRIAVDTGAYATGRLTAAVLENSSCRFLEAAR